MQSDHMINTHNTYNDQRIPLHSHTQQYSCRVHKEKNFYLLFKYMRFETKPKGGYRCHRFDGLGKFIPEVETWYNKTTPKGANQRLKCTTEVPQRPESPTVTLTRHACKYKVHKLHQMYLLEEFNGVYLPCIYTHAKWELL